MRGNAVCVLRAPSAAPNAAAPAIPINNDSTTVARHRWRKTPRTHTLIAVILLARPTPVSFEQPRARERLRSGSRQ